MAKLSALWEGVAIAKPAMEVVEVVILEGLMGPIIQIVPVTVAKGSFWFSMLEILFISVTSIRLTR